MESKAVGDKVERAQFCPECGTKILYGNFVCNNCGDKLMDVLNRTLKYSCRVCGRAAANMDKFCRYCGLEHL